MRSRPLTITPGKACDPDWPVSQLVDGRLETAFPFRQQLPPKPPPSNEAAQPAASNSLHLCSLEVVWFEHTADDQQD